MAARDLYAEAARECGLSAGEVMAAVSAWFGLLDSRVRRLPFGDVGRLYTAGRFARDGLVVNIPYIGRIGTVYSKYSRWRRAAAAEAGEVRLSRLRLAGRAAEAERAADAVLSGGGMLAAGRRARVPEGYRRVTLMREGGRGGADRAVPVVCKKKRALWLDGCGLM